VLRSLDGSDLIDEVVLGFVSPVGMLSEGGLIGELSVTQGTLMDVWEVCLCVEGSQDGIVGPKGAIDAEVAAGKLWILGHALDRGDGVVWSRLWKSWMLSPRNSSRCWRAVRLQCSVLLDFPRVLGRGWLFG
jgi:hypothetical protein